MDDRYCYPGTNVLINNYDIRDKEKLNIIELHHWRANERKLLSKFPESPKIDLELWKYIHKETFGTLYPWAGEIRNVMIAKGSSIHAVPSLIVPYANQILKELKAEKYLHKLDKRNFVQRGAYYLEELNVIHPFREGNTRTLKLFFSLLSKNAGYEVDWTSVGNAKYEQAEKESFTMANKDKSPFYDILKDAVTKLDLSSKQAFRFKI